MLASHESLWEKILSSDAETLLANNGYVDMNSNKKINYGSQRDDKTKVVTFRAPHNTVV